MENQYDIIIVGAGLSGCFAALAAANHGKRILVLEKDTYLSDEKRPFVEPMLLRDYKNLQLNLSIGCTISKGFVNVTGRKIQFEYEYPDQGSTYVLMKGNAFLSKMLDQIRNSEHISYLNATCVVRLIMEDGRYCGVECSSGEKFSSSVIILSTGSDSIDQFNIKANHRWPEDDGIMKHAIAITTRIKADRQVLVNRFNTKTYEFYKRSLRDFYIYYPIDDYVYCESVFTDVSPTEAIIRMNSLLAENPISEILLKGFNISDLSYQMKQVAKFGVIQPSIYPGLIITGDALNIDSPAFLTHCSLYYSILTSQLAGMIATNMCGSKMANDGTFVEEYEVGWKEMLVGLKYDYKIARESKDQLDVFGKWANSVLSHHSCYYPEINFVKTT